MNELSLVTDKDLTLVEENLLNEKQLKILLRKTHSKYVRKRPAKGGGQWDYVTAGYVKKTLNLLFGWNWSFEIVDENVYDNEVVVKGRLSFTVKGVTVTKMQYGNKDIIRRKADQKPLSIGNDMKAAASDALKKCAAEIGIAADIYNKMDFIEVDVVSEDEQLAVLQELYAEKGKHLTKAEQTRISEIINSKESASYTKSIRILKQCKTVTNK